MSVRILYFAALREAVGTSREEAVLPSGIATVGDLRRHLAARGAPWRALAEMKNLRTSVNQRMAGADAAVADGDEVAFFPPVTGG
jgi:molybdopterin synthase sulfur carrier subunit